jgi:hypothetical protein
VGFCNTQQAGGYRTHVDGFDPAPAESEFAEDGFSEEELAELAMAADPDAPVDDDAVPLARYLGQLPLVLPQWYMPPAVSGRGGRWRVAVVLAIVLALVMIDAWGLCSTYGSVTLA